MNLVLATLSMTVTMLGHSNELPTESISSELLRRQETETYRRFRLELEGQAAWVARNDVAIPGDTGTRFSMNDLTGDGPFPAGRLTFDAHVTGRHGLRLVIAPLEFSGTGSFDTPVSFAGTTFAPGVDTRGKYKFNTYRLTYRYGIHRGARWDWDLGATLLVRDAEISVEQGGTEASDDNVGLVPLFHVDGEYRFTPRWNFLLNFDGLASAQGRAFDAALKLGYDLSDRWRLSFGYRTLEGGADNDDVHNFAWFHYAVASVSFRF